jgi:hypothetical protein
MIWLVTHHAGTVDLHGVGVLVGLVRLYREDGVSFPGLLVLFDYVLVNVDDVLHVYQCTSFVGSCASGNWGHHSVLAKDADGVFRAREHDKITGSLAGGAKVSV